MLTLKGFKEIHGISEIKFKKSSRTNRLVAMDLKVNLIVTSNPSFDITKELFVTFATSQSGEPIFVICNQSSWSDSNVVL
jgi:hypothetical protein